MSGTSRQQDGAAEPVLSRPVDSAEELNEILDNMPGMVTLWGPDGRNRFANAAYTEWFDLPLSEVHGKHINELMGPELYAQNRQHVEAALAGEPQLYERTVVDSDGTSRYLQAQYIPRFVDGEPAGFFALVSDITPRVRAEKALQDSVRQVALLEERQRIASDLHDLVIQRLFGAGLELSLVFRAGPERAEQMWPRVWSAADGIDDAIRELRKAIHSLRELMTPTQVPASIERIIGNAGRALGFVPTVTYTGSLERVPPEVVQDLLAVLTEALSNVAKHAGATEVRVTLACAEHELLLQVVDDGRGVTEVALSSGLSNMRRRAERFGGTFKLGDNTPRGTVVEWMVPLSPAPAGRRTA